MSKYFHTPVLEDERGFFVKTYTEEVPFVCKEIFSTFSKKGVARGLHYQYSNSLKCGASRVMTVISGAVLDFLVKFDPRSDKVLAIQEEQLGPRCKNNSLLIDGNGEYCHGFVALNDCVCVYASSQSYLKEDDFGYDLLSLNYDFTKIMNDIGVNQFIRSKRDLSFPSFVDD